MIERRNDGKTLVGRGIPAPLHASPHTCAICGETLYYNFFARPKNGDGYYLFAHRTGLGDFTFVLEKSLVQNHGGFGSKRTTDAILAGGAGIHQALDCLASDGDPWLIAVARYVNAQIAAAPGGAGGIAEGEA